MMTGGCIPPGLYILEKYYFPPMRQTGNLLFSNPVKANRLKVRVRPMLMGLQLHSGRWVLCRSLTTK
jgi:hypothetical protein